MTALDELKIRILEESETYPFWDNLPESNRDEFRDMIENNLQEVLERADLNEKEVAQIVGKEVTKQVIEKIILKGAVPGILVSISIDDPAGAAAFATIQGLSAVPLYFMFPMMLILTAIWFIVLIVTSLAWEDYTSKNGLSKWDFNNSKGNSYSGIWKAIGYSGLVLFFYYGLVFGTIMVQSLLVKRFAIDQISPIVQLIN